MQSTKKTRGSTSSKGRMPREIYICKANLDAPEPKDIEKVDRDRAAELIATGIYRPVKRQYVRPKVQAKRQAQRQADEVKRKSEEEVARQRRRKEREERRRREWADAKATTKK